MPKILLGLNAETGEEVYIHKMRHMVTTGLTDASGKTTAQEAVMTRSGMRGLVFITKPGEKCFQSAPRVPLFFRERSDWRFVEGILSSSLREKVERQPGMRTAIIKTCRGTRGLKDVLANVERALTHVRSDSFIEGVYTNLAEYLRIVVPEIERLQFSRELRLAEGVNVMDLEDLPTEMQQLIIASCLDELSKKAWRDLIVVIPEAWKSVPQTRGSPVKVTLEAYVRQGAVLNKWLIIDTQDIGGVDKTPLRNAGIWLLGRQMDEREVKRTLGEIPLPLTSKPKPHEVMRLPLGHFYAVLDDRVILTYILPAGIPAEVGREVVRKKISVEDVWNYEPKWEVDEDLEWKRKYEEAVKELREECGKRELLEVEKGKTEEAVKDKNMVISRLNADIQGLAEEKNRLEAKLDQLKAAEEALAALRKLIPVSPATTAETKAIGIQGEEFTVNVHPPAQRTVEFKATTNQGKIMYLIAEERKGEPTGEAELEALAREHGWILTHNSMAPELAKLVKQGILVKESTKPLTYRLPRKVNVNVEAEG